MIRIIILTRGSIISNLLQNVKGCFHLVDRTSLTEMDEITILRCLTEKTDRIIRPGDKIKLNMVSLYNLLRNPDFRFLHNLLTLYNKRRDQN